MAREPIDDRDRRIQDDSIWRDRQIDRAYERTKSERQQALDRLRSSEALAARYGLGSSLSPLSRAAVRPKQYPRYRFIKDNAKHVVTMLESFVVRIKHGDFIDEDGFEKYKDHTLEAIDRYLPPSDDKEAIYTEVLEVEYGFPFATEEKLVALAERVRRHGQS